MGHVGNPLIINVLFFAANVKPRRGLIFNNPRLRERSDRSLGEDRGREKSTTSLGEVE